MNTDFRSSLRTVDETGRRIWVYADIFKGPWRARRRTLAAILVIIYLGLPWIHINGLPLLQLDLPNNRLVLFAKIFWLHELGIIIPLFFSGIFILFAVTAVWGRVWCGWGCPQTVFMEFVFRPIEKWIEGRPSARRNLDQASNSWDKFSKKLLKWSAFFGVSFVIANSFLAYFVGSEALLNIVRSSPTENPGLFGLMTLVTAGFLFNFGWFREQMCTITCPYGRLQSMLTEKRTLIVGYDARRGEPRGKQYQGDCVDCKRCVQVCPTGIDIRDGLQLECVNCLACVDACNAVMLKVKRPPNLISLTTEIKLEGASEVKTSYIRPLAYAILSSILILVSGFQLAFRQLLEVEVERGGAVQFEQVGENISNRIHLRLKNKSGSPIRVKLEALESDTEIILAENNLELGARDSREVVAFVRLPLKNFVSGLARRTIVYKASDGERYDSLLTLFGPST